MELFTEQSGKSNFTSLLFKYIKCLIYTDYYLLKCNLTVILNQEISVNDLHAPIHSEICLRHVNHIKQGMLANNVLENNDSRKR